MKKLEHVMGRYELADGRVFLLRESKVHDMYYATEIVNHEYVDRLAGNFKQALYYIYALMTEARGDDPNPEVAKDLEYLKVKEQIAAGQ